MSLPSIARRQAKPTRVDYALFRTLFENAGVGIAVVGANTRLLDVNTRLCRMLDHEADQLLKLGIDEIVHPDDWPSLRSLFKDVAGGRRSEFTIKKRCRRSDGRWVWVKWSVTPLESGHIREKRMMAVVDEVDGRRASEPVLREPLRDESHGIAGDANAERMAVIGTLSAGLGHDMANLLVPVHIRLEALSRMDLSEDVQDHLLAIKSSAEFLQKLSGGLRLLATDSVRARGEPTRLDAWWKETGGILRTVLPGSVSLEAQLPKNTWVCMTRPALMQAVFNLVQNAGDALRDRIDGRVVIRAEADGDHVRVIVSDNGPGMTEEVRRRCLEPFFTTRHRTISTGLGLSIVYGLVKEAGGDIDIQSQFGQGTTFSIRLKRGLAPEERAMLPRRAGIVQVEDARMRAIVALELRALHYDVTFDCAAAATPDLVVCDRWPLQSEVNARVVLLADGPNIPASAIALGSKPAVQAIRNALRELTAV